MYMIMNPYKKNGVRLLRNFLMGVQASLWTEFCNKPEDVDYLLFPRLSAFGRRGMDANRP